MSSCAHSTEKNFSMLSGSRIDGLGIDEDGRCVDVPVSADLLLLGNSGI